MTMGNFRPPLSHDSSASNDRQSSSSGLTSPLHTSSQSSLPSSPPNQDDGFDLLSTYGVELDSLPRQYLESYPYPAFITLQRVIHSAHGSNGVSTLPPEAVSKSHTLSPLWANGKWHDSVGRHTLAECLSSQNMDELAGWLGEQHSLLPSDDGKASPGLNHSRSTPNSEQTSLVPSLSTLAPTITLEFEFTTELVMLELTKTVMPMYRWCGNQRTRITSHDFAIVTSVPGSRRPSPTKSKVPASDPGPPCKEPLYLLPEGTAVLSPTPSVQPTPDTRDPSPPMTPSASPKVLSGRRAGLIRDMGQRTAIARTMCDFDKAVLETLEEYPEEAPFCLLYHVEQISKSVAKSRANSPSRRREQGETSVRLHYINGIGVPDDHVSAPATVDMNLPASPEAMIADAFTGLQQAPTPPPNRNYAPLSPVESTSYGIDSVDGPTETWPFMEALQTRRPVIIPDCSALIEGYPVRIWDGVPKSAVVIPAFIDSENLPGAVLVLGLRLPNDEEYRNFIHVLRLQMAFHYAAVRSYEADQKRIDDLAALDRAKSVLFSNVSHELFTPLSLISGPLDDVLAELPSGRLQESLALAKRNVNRLTRLVSMLMDVSSLEAGRLHGSFRLVNLGRLTRDIACLFRKAAEHARLEFFVDCDLTDQDIYIDREKWEKILFTLVGNALKYTLSGSVRVELRYTADEGIVRIIDTGVGFPSQDLEMFGEQEPNANGLGIALSFTQKLIQLYGGRIYIDSRTPEESPDDHGTAVTIHIPIGTAHLPPGSIDYSHDDEDSSLQKFHRTVLEEIAQCHWGWVGYTARDPLTTISPESSSPDQFQKVRGIDPSTLFFKRDDVILLVDDMLDTRVYMRSIFEPFCTVIEARDGQEALDKFKSGQKPPDLIIADVVLPKINGFELLRELRRGTKDQKFIPVILLTTMDDARADGAFGAEDYLPKPFNARELIARAHMQLQLGKKRRMMERQFDERTNELRILTEMSPVAIVRCRPDGYVTWANSAWYQVSGYPPGEPVTNWGDYVRSDHQLGIREAWNDFVQSDRTTVEAEWQWQNGRWVFTKVVRLDVFDGNTEPGFMGCCVDITERKLNEQIQRERVEEAEQRRREAEEAKYQQELLIDITSHEIRNPISSLMQISINHCASLVKSNLLAWQEQMSRAAETNEDFKPTQQMIMTIDEDLDALDSIYQCGLTQERISNDVLSLGKIQLDRMEMHDSPTNIRKVAEQLINVFQYEARVKRLTLSMTLSDNFDKLGVTDIMTDHVRLGQVLTNLVSNAIRFTSNSDIRKVNLSLDIGRHPPAEDSCTKSDDENGDGTPISPKTDLYLFATVSDTGPGLSESELAVLFQRFSQASPKTHTVFGGSGLGLFVCRLLTERMGGRIDVTSEPGKGAQFHFFIKTRIAPPPEVSEVETPETLDEQDRLLRGPFRPHILIVEDNLINRKVLLRQLRHVGLTAEAVSNGLEAVERLRRSCLPHESNSVVDGNGDAPNEEWTKPFQCVLMDLEMPIMDGYAAAAQIRDDEVKGVIIPTAIVALTGNARQAQLTDAMRDFDQTVVKPYRLDQLLGKIEYAVRVKESTEQELDIHGKRITS